VTSASVGGVVAVSPLPELCVHADSAAARANARARPW